MEDTELMRRAIELSEKSLENLDMPVGCVIASNGEIIAESENLALTHKNFTHHAEILAMLKASQVLKSSDLSACSLYTSMEPCPMCALMIREYRISKVVYAMPLPDMGGVNKFPVLTDTELNEKHPGHFGDVPQIIGEFLLEEALRVWKKRKELKQAGLPYKLEKY